MKPRKRAAVIIAVRKTGNLPELRTVYDCADRMAKWAYAQGMPKRLVKVLTDERKPLYAKQVSDAVTKLAKEDGLEQILVYFAGHGTVIGGELWLLSGAPEDPAEAVNLEGSIALARQCGVPHVVFISDTCRTSPVGIQAQNVRGREIFPNFEPADEQPVDVFFACRIGSVAHEIKDPVNAAGAYESVYTEALLTGLEGNQPDIVQTLEEDSEILAVVHPKPLGDFLETEVPRRLLGRSTPEGPLIQVPHARLTSEGEHWIAMFPGPPSRGPRAGPPGGTLRSPIPPLASPPGARGVAQRALRAALSNDPRGALEEVRHSALQQVPDAETVAESLERSETPFGPQHFESECGFKSRGARIVAAYVDGDHFAEVRGESVRIQGRRSFVPTNPVSTLITLDYGVSLMLPAIPSFIGAIESRAGHVLSVSYEPSDNTSRWPEYMNRLAEIRVLGALVSASARLGTLAFEGDDAAQLARQMQMAKNADPAMALYAAYAYHQLGLRKWLAEMSAFQRSDLHFRFFDLALLNRELDGRFAEEEADVFPKFPIMSAGWTLLSAYGVRLDERVAPLREHLVPSLWTLLDEEGTAIARQSLIEMAFA